MQKISESWQSGEKPRLYVHGDAFPFESEARARRQLPRAAQVVTVEIIERSLRGRGEAVPFARYGETIEEVVDTIERLAPEIANGLEREALQEVLPMGAARNALDLALWDLEAKKSGSSVWQMAGLAVPQRVETAFTIDFGTPEVMAAAAAGERDRPLLKLVLGGPGDLDRVAAVREASPKSRLMLDARESWSPRDLVDYWPALHDLGVELIEQPLPAGADGVLAELDGPVPVCADESCRDHANLPWLAEHYEAIKIKLDKTGGLTEALRLAHGARSLGLRIMVGGALASSLGLAPAVLLAQLADWVDLDQALLLRRDHQPGLRYDGSTLYPPSVSLWG